MKFITDRHAAATGAAAGVCHFAVVQVRCPGCCLYGQFNLSHLQVSQFRDLPPQTIENIALVLSEKVFPPKTVIHYQGNKVEDLFFIQRGHVKVTVVVICAVQNPASPA